MNTTLMKENNTNAATNAFNFPIKSQDGLQEVAGLS